MREKEHRDRVFLAALQGVDLDEGTVRDDKPKDDIKNLNGYAAAQEGFGIGMGLGYMEVND